MAAKKSTRSSKTDHVLSLLSHAGSQESAPADSAAPDSAAPEETPAAVSASEAAAAPQPAPTVAPITTSQRLAPPILEVARSNNEALEETIHLALEAALEDAVAPVAEAAPIAEPAPESSAPQAAPVPEPVSVPEPAPVTEPADVSPSEPAPEPISPMPTEPAPEPPSAAQPEPVSEPSPKPQQAPQPAQTAAVSPPVEHFILEQLPDGAQLVNIMESLVRQKVEHYAKMFHLCCCPRCLADSTALALSRLPAKYVVLNETAYRPMMSFYEAKFDSMVTAQIIYACKQVLESPRHTL